MLVPARGSAPLSRLLRKCLTASPLRAPRECLGIVTYTGFFLAETNNLLLRGLFVPGRPHRYGELLNFLSFKGSPGIQWLGVILH